MVCKKHGGWRIWQRRLRKPPRQGFFELYGALKRHRAGKHLVPEPAEAGTALRSADGGQNWETIEPFYNGSLYGAVSLGHLRVRSQTGAAAWPLSIPE